jgi:hypothetical protein
VALALASYGGFYTTTPPSSESAFGLYWPALVDPAVVDHRVRFGDGRVIDIPHTAGEPWIEPAPEGGSAGDASGDGATTDAPLGLVCGGRSGDKGGNANIGLWGRTGDAYEWLAGYLTSERMAALLGPEGDGREVRRYLLPNLNAVNFVVVGILGDGVASSTRYDPQAKGLAEYVRSRVVPVPTHLLR